MQVILDYIVVFVIITHYRLHKKISTVFKISQRARDLLRHVLERMGKGFLAERKLADGPDLSVLHRTRGQLHSSEG